MRFSLKTVFVAAAIGLATISMSATKMVDATTLRIINRGWSSGRTTFGRIPFEHLNKFNTDAQYASNCSSGVAIRFATNSRTIGVKYSLYSNAHVNIQAPSGTKGVDLYILDEKNYWRHVSSSRPEDQREQEYSLVERMDGSMHECMLYLPTYDGINELYIKVDDEAIVTSGNYDAIDVNKRVVLYGTSIMQATCSRGGTCASAIISRALNCEVINLGFSGGGKMEITAAEAINTIENVCAYIIDPVPNCDLEMCQTLTYDFVKKIRSAHPGVPIIMVEGHLYPYAHFTVHGAYLIKKNEAFRAAYDKLYAEDPTNLFIVSCEELDPAVLEGTVEGIHMTDVGLFEYAKVLIPYLEPFAKGTELMRITAPSTMDIDVPLTPTISWSNSQRKGTLEISKSSTFAESGAVYSGEGVGSVTVPKYALASGTHYYARVAYDTNGVTSYTPVVEFTTQNLVPQTPSIVHPTDGGVLYANQTFKFSPVEGAESLRLEVCASTSFSGRSTYIAGAISTSTWSDTKTADQIKLGSTSLVNGNTYYARVRATYGNSGQTVFTAYSEPISFVYNSGAGVANLTVDDLEVVATEYFDPSGRAIQATENQQPVIVCETLSDGSVRVSKAVR